MKKICFIIPSLQAGGMERVFAELLWHFSKKNDVELHLILYGMTREIFYEIPENIRVYKPSFEFNNSYRLYYTYKTIIYLRKQVKLINPASILSFGEIWNNFVLLALYRLKFPVTVSDRCQPDKSLGKLHDSLRKWLYPKAKNVIVQTELAKNIYEKFLANAKIDVIGNPIRDITTDQIVKRENIVLTVGRLIATKHHDKLIELFVKIDIPDWKLIIVGNDALKQNNFNKLKNLIKKLNAEDRVILAGQIKNVEQYYLKSKIFAFTSSSEGFPNVIGEAMSAGLPVIAFDCIAGPSEIITDGEDGFLIPLFDYSLFQEKLTLLMKNNELREMFGANGKSNIKIFSSESICEKYYCTLTS